MEDYQRDVSGHASVAKLGFPWRAMRSSPRQTSSFASTNTQSASSMVSDAIHLTASSDGEASRDGASSACIVQAEYRALAHNVDHNLINAAVD